jgi:hypothetical protein
MPQGHIPLATGALTDCSIFADRAALTVDEPNETTETTAKILASATFLNM